MIKLFHGRTNYRRLVRFLDCKNCIPKRYKYMGEIMTIEPLVEVGEACYRVSFRNDTIDFFADIMNSTVIPLRMVNIMVNIIEDIDQKTFVTDTRIAKPLVMPKADERLYRVCLNSIFDWGEEII